MIYYTTVIGLSCLTMILLSIQVKENARFDRETKKNFYLTYAVIGLAAFSEWISVFLNGAPGWTLGIHAVFKCLDYVLTPLAGYMFIRQVTQRNRLERFLLGLLLFNAILEGVSAFTGWIYYLDLSNTYHHGRFYAVYVAIYAVTIVFVTVEFVLYGKRFRARNRLSLYTTILMVCAGILVQEICGGDVRTAYLGIAIGSALLFIHYDELLQTQNDDLMQLQERLLATDALTGLYSRYAYSRQLAEYEKKEGGLPATLTVVAIDINGLKSVNDEKGHKAGDELIKGAADCVFAAFAESGKCYRTGGDEFVVLLEVEPPKLTAMLARLQRETGTWRGSYSDKLALSAGSASAGAYPGISLEGLVSVADKEMYRAKNEYYINNGLDRRKR